MSRLRAMLIVAALLAAFTPGPARAEGDCQTPVETTSGLVSGLEENGVCVWKGVPFAEPPVGELRWASPEPRERWDGVLAATKFGNRCMQRGIMAAEGITSKEGMSEDCLYLNVWRPKREGKFPVLVWVHGGGYHGGSGTTPWYWGDRLAEQGDLVVVTINYRLNVFGFFAHPGLRAADAHGSTGSEGTLDQVAALEWVHDNIAGFGGDPGNVTIFGESAGGWSICTLLATPLTRGLIHRALLESGGCEQSGDLEQGYADAEEVAGIVGCAPDDLACLRAVPAKVLLKKSAGSMTKGFRAQPHHDGYVLTGTPLEMIRAGNYNHIPFIAGHNRDEFGNMLRLYGKYKRVKAENYRAGLIDLFGIPEDDADRLVELYPLDEFANRPVLAFGRMFGADAALACPTYRGLYSAAEQAPPTWYYRFDYDDMKYGKYTGAAHAMEIPFIFGNLDRAPADLLYNRKNLPQALELSGLMQGYVINFARFGDPNGPGLPPWPTFDPQVKDIMVFDVVSGPETVDLFHRRCAFWEEKHASIENIRR